MNFLLRMPNWIGDLVMATPILADLRRAFPDAKITAMCVSPLSDLLKTDPNIDELLSFSKVETGVILQQIRLGKFDLGILLTNSFSSAWWFFLGRVQKRIGYSSGLRSFLLTDPVFRSEIKEHQVDVYKRLLEKVGVQKSETTPCLYVEKQEKEQARARLFAHGYLEGMKLIGIHPGAAYGSAKRWPIERYKKLAQMLLQEDVFLLFFGDASMREVLQEMSATLGERVVSFAGLTTLRELVCLIQQCDVFVTNDSGPMHIADACKVPLVALFGSTDCEVTGPFGQRESVIYKKPFCSPCFKRECPLDFRCMKDISVEEVVKEVRRKCFVR